ncbi:MAG: YcbK family protein [Burkholderiales bacterium]
MLSNHVKQPVGRSPSCGRRRFLAMSVGALAVAGMRSRPAFAESALLMPERTLSFSNLHTGENLKVAYWAEGGYVAKSLSEINYLLRDFRNGEIKEIDLGLLNLLHAVTLRLGTSGPIELISGYRSPATNSMLHARSGGVAKHSLHMEGIAADIRIPGHDLRELHEVAVAMRGGGVGYYPQSGFVHVDVGRPRYWTGA